MPVWSPYPPSPVPPSVAPASPPLVQPPAGPNSSETIDSTQQDVQPMVKSLERLEYELNKDLHRAVFVLPMDLNVAAWLVAHLVGWGPEMESTFKGNWLVESHTVSLEASDFAYSDVELRGCQDISKL